MLDFPPLYRVVSAAGYTGDIEVGIVNADIWAADPDSVVATKKAGYRSCL